MFKKITENVEIHQTLPDIPNLTTEELKKEWDKGCRTIKEVFNNNIEKMNTEPVFPNMPYVGNEVNKSLIIENGKNPNGEWVKFGSGIMIQWGENTGIDNGSRTITLPNSFIDNKYSVSASLIVFDTNYIHYAQTHDRNTTDFKVTLRYCSESGGAWRKGSNAFSWQAIGRWK